MALAVLVGTPVFIGFFHPFYSNFFRSPEWTYTSIAATAAVTLPLALLHVRHMLRSPALLKGVRVTVFRVVALSITLLILFGMFVFFVVAYTIPDIYTRMAGEQVEIRGVKFDKSQSYGRGGCHYGVRSASFARGIKGGKYCAGEAEWEALPESGLARAHARQSWFGRYVYFVEPESDAFKER